MDDDTRRFLRDAVQTVGSVVLVALVLFALTGVWPPMVAVESGSMHPHMQKGDLIVVTQPSRWTAAAAQDPGIVTYQASKGYSRFKEPGDVIVYDPPNWNHAPIIHRARFHVTKGENWYDKANKSYLPPGVDNCSELQYCPAPYSGYITKGDANPSYDQTAGIAPPVKPKWIIAKAEIRIPWLGWIRLFVTGQA